MGVSMFCTENAREEFKTAFPMTEILTNYIAVYTSRKGYEIALERDRSGSFYVWLQKFDVAIEGVSVRNLKLPGHPYGRKQTRNSNLNNKNAPKLKYGNRVWYVQVDDIGALKKLIDWYCNL